MHQPHSRVKVVVTATREQWMIAREAARVLDSADTPTIAQRTIPIAVSARHVHLTEEACRVLFGDKHVLHMQKKLSQPGQWAAEESVDIVGPHGELKNVRILGPCRDENQIEISETDAFALGIDVPLRLSGQVKNTPSVLLRGSAGTVRSTGAIVAQRHIHAHTDTAALLRLTDGQLVDVEVDSAGRSLVFKDVAVRVSNHFLTEMHIDTDEANAAHLEHGAAGVLKL
jgi:acetate kinase